MSEGIALKRDEKGRLVKGTPPGPGRTEGSISILTDIKRKLTHLKEKSPEEYQELIDYYWQNKKMRDLLIRMIDGQPRQNTDITSGGEKIKSIFATEEMIDDLSNNNSDEETGETKQTN